MAFDFGELPTERLSAGGLTPIKKTGRDNRFSARYFHQLFSFFHFNVTFYRVEGLVTDNVLYSASILCGDLRVHPYGDQHLREDRMALVDLPSPLFSERRQNEITVTVGYEIPAFLKKSHRTADTGL